MISAMHVDHVSIYLLVHSCNIHLSRTQTCLTKNMTLSQSFSQRQWQLSFLHLSTRLCPGISSAFSMEIPQSDINTLRPRQNGCRIADDTFKRIFLNENVRISIKISLKFVPKGQINNIPALVQIMAWRRPGDKPLSEPMVVGLPTHIWVTRPQWVKPLILKLH